MHVAFVSSLFPPEPEPSSVMAWQLAHALCHHGHEVRMVVPFPNRPGGHLYPGYQRRFHSAETIDGIRVIRCPTWLVGSRRRPWNRVLENLSFGVSGALTDALESKPDVLILETWPLVAMQMWSWQARLRGVPFLYYVKDVYPEVLEHSGLIQPNGRFARALRAWDRQLCLQSDKVVVISESMRDLLLESRRLPPDHIAVVPDWIDEQEFTPLPRDNGWRRNLQVSEDTFVVLYAGTLGNVSGADILIAAADHLRARSDILFLCVGQGVLRDQMMHEAQGRGLLNLRFLPFQDRSLVPQMHAAADACLLTMRPDFPDASVPSKLISYLAAGRPVISSVAAEGSVAKLIQSAAAGLVTPAGDARALAEAIVYMSAHPAERALMASKARSYFSEHLSFRSRYQQFAELLAEAVARHNGAFQLGSRR